MRRVTILLLILLFAAGFASAQTFDSYEQSIQDFANGVANSLPLNAAVGLNWSDAYIGQFPHFGVGTTVGASTVPYTAVKPVLDALSLSSALESGGAFQYISQFGAPLPAYAVEARLGGLILPFDVGVKVGALPPDFDMSALVPGVNLEYLLVGANARLNLIKENFILPEVSVGGGYTRLNAKIGLDGIAGGDITLASFDDPRSGHSGQTIDFSLTDPTLEYFWQANVVDLQVQASKNLLIFTPYIGAAASIGFGEAGGGLSSSLVTTPSLSDQDLADINAALEQAGQATLPQFNATGLSVTANMPAGWAFRAFGGVSINLLILKLDIGGMYDFIGQNYGFTVGTRIQL